MMNLHASLACAYGAHPRQRFDLFVPIDADQLVLVACFHGGGWSQGRHEELRPFCLHLAEQGFATASVGCRLLEDGARHGQELLDDAQAGVRAAVEEAALAGASSASVVLLGSGSGSLVALTAAAQLAAAATAGPRVRGVIACGVSPTLEPWEGCPLTTARRFDQFAGGQRQTLSPMHLAPASFPPLLLLHGDGDQEVPARIAQRLHARVVEAGESSVLAVLSGLGHQFIENPAEHGAKAALERIVPFLKDQAREPSSERLFIGRCPQD
jgi:acetyl esterase/lipase